MNFSRSVSNQVLQQKTISTTIVHTWKQNTGIRFAASGILGNAIFFSLDKLLLPLILQMTESNKLGTMSTWKRRDLSKAASKWLSQNAESVSFFVAYLLDIIAQRERLCIMIYVRSVYS